MTYVRRLPVYIKDMMQLKAQNSSGHEEFNKSYFNVQKSCNVFTEMATD